MDHQRGDITNFALKLLERGSKVYIPAPLPVEIERGPVGKCFDWSALQAAKLHPKYKYVEGIAEIEGQWGLHAWLSDGIQAFDPTWAVYRDGVETREAPPAKYIGIEMDIKKVAKFMTTTKYQGVLGNYWRNPTLADACFSGVTV